MHPVSAVPFRTALARGLRRRCPHCGAAPLFRGSVTLVDPCPTCGLRRLRQHGDAWAFFLLLDRVVFVAPLVAAIYLGVSPDGSLVLAAGIAVLATAVLLTTPHRYGAAVALEYLVRGATGDLEPPGAPPATTGAVVPQASGASPPGRDRQSTSP